MPSRIARKALIVSSILLLSTVSRAGADVIYTSETAFQSALNTGYNFDNFGNLTAFTNPTTVTVSAGTPTFAYNISAPSSGIFINQDGGGLNAVGNFAAANPVLFSLTSGNVYAFGAEYYLTDIDGNPQTGNTTVTYNDGTIGTVPSLASVSASPYAFYGVISAAPITSVSVFDAGTITSSTSPTSTPVPPRCRACNRTNAVGGYRRHGRIASAQIPPAQISATRYAEHLKEILRGELPRGRDSLTLAEAAETHRKPGPGFAAEVSELSTNLR